MPNAELVEQSIAAAGRLAEERRQHTMRGLENAVYAEQHDALCAALGVERISIVEAVGMVRERLAALRGGVVVPERFETDEMAITARRYGITKEGWQAMLAAAKEE